MRLVKYSHSCLRLEQDGAVLVIDPGVWAEPAALDGVDAVLITHEHADHLDPDRLADTLARRPAVRVYAHAEVLPRLSALDGALEAVESGQSFTAAGLPVRAYGGLHAEIHPDIPRVVNLGFLVGERVYHPGDSFDVPRDAEIDTLFVPISAPWLKVSESVDFVRAVRPRRAYALHDGLLNDAGLGITDGVMSGLSGCDYARLSAGTALDA
jgi:L-ascorbate metabolism protein UlaG (beta-lactamase superfamily)